MKTEYYKTPKGHCYKKNKDGCKRISKEDYNKAIKKSKERGDSKKSKEKEKRTKVKTDIKYQKKINKKGQKYYQKIDKTGKKIRISKKEYEKNMLKGGVGKKRKTPNTNVNNLKEDDTCFDSVMLSEENVKEYLNEDPKNYVSRIKMNDGTLKYYCHNIDNDRIYLTTDYIYNYDDDVPDNKKGKRMLNEFYICKKKLNENTHLDRSKLKQNINSSDDTYIKLPPNLLLIKTPSWLRNGNFPNLPDNIYHRVFNLRLSGTKANALVSVPMLFSTAPSSQIAVSADHCNQTIPVSIYTFEPEETWPVQRPITPPPRPPPTSPPPVRPRQRRRRSRDPPRPNANGWITPRRSRITPQLPSTQSPRQLSTLPSFLGNLIPPSPISATPSRITPGYRRRTEVPISRASSGQPAPLQNNSNATTNESN